MENCRSPERKISPKTIRRLVATIVGGILVGIEFGGAIRTIYRDTISGYNEVNYRSLTIYSDNILNHQVEISVTDNTQTKASPTQINEFEAATKLVDQACTATSIGPLEERNRMIATEKQWNQCIDQLRRLIP
jgi:hypothetical protein